MKYEVRRIRPGEGARLREIRLAALLDAPGAFASTYAEESLRPTDVWEEAALARSAGTADVNFVAEFGNRWVGLVGAFHREDRPGAVALVSMWVDSQYRRLGVGRRLIETTVAWARETGGATVDLWVAHDNPAAIALYEATGFVVTEDYQPLPSDPCKDEVRMVLAL